MSDSIRPRRNLLASALAAVTGAVFSRAARAAGAAGGAAARSGEPVTTHMRVGDPPAQPLDTMLLFERGDDSNGRAMTHEVLSLVHQERGKNSYPWTLYTSLETHHEAGDACVHCARLHKYGPGWSSGVHSEVFNHGRAVALGVNIEMSNDFAGSEPTQVIGLNIQAVGGPSPMQYAIHVHDHDESAHFETGIGLAGRGKVGLDVSGNYDTAIHTRGNNIRLGEGGCVELDDRGEIQVRYKEGKIEFLNRGRRVAHIDVNGEDHAL
jgi:hypothetical protein